MPRPGTYAALNRLLTTIYRSLPMYLKYACPWTHLGDEKSLDALNHIVEDQQQLSTRLADHIITTYGPVDSGDYPLDFPDTHDLAFDYLIGKLLACHKVDVASIEACLPTILDDRVGLALAEEALGSARGHLETLEELAAQQGRQGISWAKP